MPELPEVEVVRRSLSDFIIGLKIKKVRIINSNLRFRISKNFKKSIEKQTSNGQNDLLQKVTQALKLTSKNPLNPKKYFIK